MPSTWNPIAPPVTGLVLPVRIDPTGRDGPTRGRSQGPRWRRTSPGLFVPAGVPTDLVEQRILEVASAVGAVDGQGGGRAVVTGWAALRLHGGGYFDGLARDGRTPLPVPVAANGERFAGHPGLHAPRDTVPDDEVVEVQGLRVASVERALFDEIRRLRSLRRRVVAADMAFAGRLSTLAGMRRYCAERRWYRDVRNVGAALDLSCEDSRSGPETDFRLIWELDAGWGRPLANHWVLDRDGRGVAVPDLIDPERGVVGEYAGAHHRDIDRHESDIAREAALRGVGLEYVEVVGRDLRHPERVVRRMEEAASRVDPSRARWVLGPPADFE